MTIDQLEHHQNLLLDYIGKEQYKGYDPIDIHDSFLPFRILPNYFRAAISQIHLRNPINLRPLLGIQKAYNPMALGVILEALSFLYRMSEDPAILKKMNFIYDQLIGLRSPGFNGYGWGNNFDWAGQDKTVPKFYPNLVTTCHAARGIFELYSLTQDDGLRDVLSGIETFLLNHIPRIETPEGICLSYTDLDREACYNANLMGAEILIKLFSVFRNSEAQQIAQRAMDFTLAHQQCDGHWNYSINLDTGIERQQIDFHQGYILVSLFEFMKYSDKESLVEGHLIKGLEYYKNRQFLASGRAIWRVPKLFPVESHHHAVGIATFARLGELDKDLLDFACKIEEWVADHLRDKRGYYYYRLNKKIKNKISYMRWTQSFMLLGLSLLRYRIWQQNQPVQ
jgi:hypothetical protein